MSCNEGTWKRIASNETEAQFCGIHPPYSVSSCHLKATNEAGDSEVTEEIGLRTHCYRMLDE